MHAVLRRVLIPLAAVLSLAACAEPDRPLYPEVTFAHLHPIKVNVGRTEVVDVFRPTLKPPHVEHEFPVSPMAAVHRWASDRLQPVGTAGVVQVVVEDASVVEVPLERTEGIEGMVTVDQAYRYDANLVVQINIIDAGGQNVGYIRIEAQRTRTVPENLTLNERDQIFFEITEALMRDFNVEAEKSMRQYLTTYVH